MNKVKFVITNCMDCYYSYTERIYTPDSFEIEIGCYCEKIEDKESYNKKHKLIVADDKDLRYWTKIPDWCPYCNKEIDLKYAGDK